MEATDFKCRDKIPRPSRFSALMLLGFIVLTKLNAF